MEDVGTWSVRRRRVNERIAQEQARTLRIGFTEVHDDRMSRADWALLLAQRIGNLSAVVMQSWDNPEDGQKAFDDVLIEIGALVHSALESSDRKHER